MRVFKYRTTKENIMEIKIINHCMFFYKQQ